MKKNDNVIYMILLGIVVYIAIKDKLKLDVPIINNGSTPKLPGTDNNRFESVGNTGGSYDGSGINPGNVFYTVFPGFYGNNPGTNPGTNPNIPVVTQPTKNTSTKPVVVGMPTVSSGKVASSSGATQQAYEISPLSNVATYNGVPISYNDIKSKLLANSQKLNGGSVTVTSSGGAGTYAIKAGLN